jgi:two-component system catabolic regulation response regulator CreB
MKQSILLIEDEPKIAEVLVYALETEGYLVKRAASASEGLDFFGKQTFDLVILDIGLPDGSGLEVCRQIRKDHDTPLFFLTAKSSEIDRIVGLELGADDYVTKPFGPREVCARVKAILRRAQPKEAAIKETDANGLIIDDARKVATLKGQEITLSRYEFGLLKMLASAPGRVYSRQQLMEKVWEDPDMSLERTVDAHVKMIRAKLREIDPSKEWIKTHRGFGYSYAA